MSDVQQFPDTTHRKRDGGDCRINRKSRMEQLKFSSVMEEKVFTEKLR
jgi:hypothetical protein